MNADPSPRRSDRVIRAAFRRLAPRSASTTDTIRTWPVRPAHGERTTSGRRSAGSRPRPGRTWPNRGLRPAATEHACRPPREPRGCRWTGHASTCCTRSAAADGSRGPPAAGRAGLDKTGRAWLGAGLVAMAPSPSGPSATGTLPAPRKQLGWGVRCSPQSTHRERGHRQPATPGPGGCWPAGDPPPRSWRPARRPTPPAPSGWCAAPSVPVA
jgi:hypothetical protein